MAVTLHDVARAAGVSIKTVSNVVNGNPHVGSETRQRVLAAIDELGYQPNLFARGLRSGRTGVIGLAVPELSLSYFAVLADAVIEAAERNSVEVLIETTRADRARELEIVNGRRLRLIDGLLLSPLGMTQSDRDLLDVDLPIVLLGERIFNGPTDHVTMENVEAARAATEHLISIGRRRIAVIGAIEAEQGATRSASLRLEGYRSALEAAGLPFDQDLVGFASPWHRFNGAATMRDMLARGVPLDGVFAFNDTLAFGAVRALQESGRAVPDDVAVIGFDDLDEGRFSLPTLSTIDPGRREIADVAVRVLLERIADPGSTPPRLIRAGYRLIARESTGFSAVSDDLGRDAVSSRR